MTNKNFVVKNGLSVSNTEVINSSGIWVGLPSSYSGPQGAQGPQGSTGVQGASGDLGAQGDTGAQGAQGDTGDTGAQGDTGTTGAQGVTGSAGAQGVTGAQGAQGVTGAQGAQGVTGSAGAQGVTGTTGAQGRAGAQGAQGRAGTQGPSGVTGSSVQGSTGPAGFQGPMAYNQNLNTNAGPTFAEVYNNGWFRNYNTNGIYNQSYGRHNYIPEGSGNSYGSRAVGVDSGYGRNGWGGYAITNDFTYMGRDSTDHGMYTTSYGWGWYQTLGGLIGWGDSTTNGSYKVYLSGSMYVSGDIFAASDERIKENIKPITNALNIVNNLRGVYYNKIGDTTKKRQVGVIAQEVDKVLPEVVSYASDSDEYAVNYDNMMAVLVEALKEQNDILDKLTIEFETLKELGEKYGIDC